MKTETLQKYSGIYEQANNKINEMILGKKVKVHFVDTFSGCTYDKITRLEDRQIEALQTQIGRTKRWFDKQNQVAFDFKLVKVETI